MNRAPDLAQIRFDNALALFDEFVRNTIKHPDAATLRGLEGRFAERVQIQPSYWSQIKSRSRQIGERLARQFEQRCKKPVGWMDVPHPTGQPAPPEARSDQQSGPTWQPADEDERFIVGLVLTYYRRHPQRARARLLDLLGEVLTPPASPEPAPTRTAAVPTSPAAATPTKPAVDDMALWSSSAAGVAPLKKKR